MIYLAFKIELPNVWLADIAEYSSTFPAICQDDDPITDRQGNTNGVYSRFYS